jgi:hypothetical protein
VDPADLERLIDRELRSLPVPRAPRALLPRVMAAVDDAARRPWYSRTWLEWPVAWQLASALMLIGVVAACGVLLPQLRAALATISFVADSTRDVEVTTTAVRVLWRTLLAPVVPWAFGLVTLMCAACAVFGTALNHLVFGRAFR